SDPVPIVADPIPKQVREILAIRAAKRSKSQLAELFTYWRTTVHEWKDANARIEALQKQWPEGSTTLALAPRSEPRETQIFLRGDLHTPGKRVSAGVPAFLHPLPPSDD